MYEPVNRIKSEVSAKLWVQVDPIIREPTAPVVIESRPVRELLLIEVLADESADPWVHAVLHAQNRHWVASLHR